ncbi:hypothetical protein FFLO_06907 [Filobasidium floriforme]|uniref:Uncharacterized protein n=1 Tax=Filobasidium floriforme TaxID=5210 RepID=A0A8K0NMK7_9TREE|nr:hypothetical protein FFLO_06907 [Filobasidium floriforme]
MSKIGRRLRKDKLVKRGSRAVTDLCKLAGTLRGKGKLDELYQKPAGHDPEFTNGRAAFFVPAIYRDESIPFPWLSLAQIKVQLTERSGPALREHLEGFVKTWEQQQAARLRSDLAIAEQKRDQYKNELDNLRISEQSSVSIRQYTRVVDDLEAKLGQTKQSRDDANCELANLKKRYEEATKRLREAVENNQPGRAAVPADQPPRAAVPVDSRRAGQAAVPVDSRRAAVPVDSCRAGQAAVPVDIAKTLKDRDTELAAVKKQLDKTTEEFQSVIKELKHSKESLEAELQSARAEIEEKRERLQDGLKIIDELNEKGKKVDEQDAAMRTHLEARIKTLTDAKVGLERDLQRAKSEIKRLTPNETQRKAEVDRYNNMVNQSATAESRLIQVEEYCADITSALKKLGIDASTSAAASHGMQLLKDRLAAADQYRTDLESTLKELDIDATSADAAKLGLRQMKAGHIQTENSLRATEAQLQKLLEKDQMTLAEATQVDPKPAAQPTSPVDNLAAPDYQDDHHTPDSVLYALMEIADQMQHGPAAYKQGLKRLTKLADIAPLHIIDAKKQKEIGLAGLEGYVYETAQRESYDEDPDICRLMIKMGHALRLRDKKIQIEKDGEDVDSDDHTEAEDDDDEAMNHLRPSPIRLFDESLRPGFPTTGMLAKTLRHLLTGPADNITKSGPGLYLLCDTPTCIEDGDVLGQVAVLLLTARSDDDKPRPADININPALSSSTILAGLSVGCRAC